MESKCFQARMWNAFILNKTNKAPEDNKEKTAHFDKLQYNKIQSCTPLDLLMWHMMRAESQEFCESLQDAFGMDS